MASNIGPVTSLLCSTLFSVKVRTSRPRSITSPSGALARETSIGLDDTATRYTRGAATVNRRRCAVRRRVESRFPKVSVGGIRLGGSSEYLSRHPGPQTRGSGTHLLGKWNAEAALPSRRLIVLCVLLGMLIIGWLRWRDLSPHREHGGTPGSTINIQPVNFANRTFDPARPPADMPPLTRGEDAECDSEFLSNASVGGQTRQTDPTHATVTITQIKMTLQLNITIWGPT